MELSRIASHLRNLQLEKGALPVEHRQKLLKKLRDLLAKEERTIAEALRRDLGKSEFEAFASEVGFVLEDIDHTLNHLAEWTMPKPVKTPLTLFPGKSWIRPEPFGVVLIIAPWNYPFQLCLAPLVGAIAAGNRVVLKPSEMALATADCIGALMKNVFSDEEVVVVEGGVEETKVLLEQRFDYIFFTGSTQVGRIIMKAAAEHLTPVTLELGGKSPLLIEESANLKMAAKRCVWGKFMNAGQTCIAPDYVLVPAGLQEKFLSEVQTVLQQFYGNHPETNPDYARIINQRHFDRLTGLIDSSKVVTRGVPNRDERYIPPTVMKDCDWGDPSMKDEIFGPVLPVIPYSNLPAAVREIQARPKPLAFYLFSENKPLATKIFDQLSFGGGCLNDTVVHYVNPYLPFGGVGASGMGKYHGKRSFETFSNFKGVVEQSTKVDIPVRYPPYKGKMKWLKLFLG